MANAGAGNGLKKPINGGKLSRSELYGGDGGMTLFARRRGRDFSLWQSSKGSGFRHVRHATLLFLSHRQVFLFLHLQELSWRDRRRRGQDDNGDDDEDPDGHKTNGHEKALICGWIYTLFDFRERGRWIQ